MPAISDNTPLTRLCVRLRSDDVEALRELAATNSELGFNMLVRQIVHSYVTQMRAIERKHIDRLQVAISDSEGR